MRTPIWAAKEPAALAKDLIDAHHPHLAGVRVEFVHQRRNPKQGGSIVLGTAQIVGAKYAAMIEGLEEADRVIETDGRFFLITIGWAGWNHLTEAQKLALVDHELCHCGKNDKGGLTLVGHDIQEFSSVVRRHGLYLKDVELFAEAIEASKQPKLPGTEFKAGELPLEAPAASEAVAASEPVEARIVMVDGVPTNSVTGEVVDAAEPGMILDACTREPLAIVTDEPMDPASAVAAVVEAALGDSLDAEHEAELELRSQAEKAAALERAEEARQAGDSFAAERTRKRDRRRSSEPLTVVAGGAAAA
jgi:hypothetical protein